MSLAPFPGALVVHSIFLGDTSLISHGIPEGNFLNQISGQRKRENEKEREIGILK